MIDLDFKRLDGLKERLKMGIILSKSKSIFIELSFCVLYILELCKCVIKTAANVLIIDVDGII